MMNILKTTLKNIDMEKNSKDLEKMKNLARCCHITIHSDLMKTSFPTLYFTNF